MSRELSTLCSAPSSPLNAGLVKVANMPTLRERLIEVADSLGNDAEFARIAKVSRSAVSQWRAGDVKSLKALSALNIQERTGFSARWLVLGIGPKKMHNKSDVGVLAHSSEHELSPSAEKKLLAVIRGFFETDEEGKTQIAEAVEAIIGDGRSAGQREQHRPSRPRRGGTNH